MPSGQQKAAWVIDVTQGTVSWCNTTANERFGDALGRHKNGLRYIGKDLWEDLTRFLSHANAGNRNFSWFLRDVNDELHRCSATIISLGSQRIGFAVEASPFSMGNNALTPVPPRMDHISERLGSLILMTFSASGERIQFSKGAEELFSGVQDIRALFAVSSAAKHFIQRLSSAGILQQEIRLSTAQGVRWFVIEAHMDERAQQFNIFAQDIQELRDYEVSLYRLQNYDNLTRLPNRHLLYHQLEKAQVTARKRDRMFGVLYLDLDGFKVVNDTFGHRIGDQLLQEVAERISSTIPSRSCLYRLGGDEFVVVMEHVQSIDELEGIAQAINATGGRPYPVSDMEMLITTSIGIACYPLHGDNTDALLKNADAAMYRAKEVAHNGYRVYHEAMSEGYSAYLTLGGGLRKAIEEGQFELFYQPKIRLVDEFTVGAEALIRWRHPELGMIPPDQFIPIAEESGLILPLGEWVIRTACEQLKEWHEQGLVAISLSVNLSGRQFMQPNLVEMVRQILDETGVDPRLLELELTESMLMSDAHETIEKLHDFRRIGLTLSIDDFGTGYSSLAYLKKFPIQTLKIDRSFVQDLGVDSDDDAIVKATIAMANSLNLKVIAEGVESRAQIDVLMGYQCQEVQGYLFAKPMNKHDFSDYIKQHSTIAKLQ